jgi:hypothetical protein
MRFKRKLTSAELQAIQACNDSEDVKTLLWKIARLRASLGNLVGGPGLILNALRVELKDEPYITEQIRLDLGRSG